MGATAKRRSPGRCLLLFMACTAAGGFPQEEEKLGGGQAAGGEEPPRKRRAVEAAPPSGTAAGEAKQKGGPAAMTGGAAACAGGEGDAALHVGLQAEAAQAQAAAAQGQPSTLEVGLPAGPGCTPKQGQPDQTIQTQTQTQPQPQGALSCGAPFEHARVCPMCLGVLQQLAGDLPSGSCSLQAAARPDAPEGLGMGGASAQAHLTAVTAASAAAGPLAATPASGQQSAQHVLQPQASALYTAQPLAEATPVSIAEVRAGVAEAWAATCLAEPLRPAASMQGLAHTVPALCPPQRLPAPRGCFWPCLLDAAPLCSYWPHSMAFTGLSP